MEMVWTWSHKSRLSRILHFLQRCCLFPRMLYFLFSIFCKEKMSIYNDFDACNEFCIMLLYILPYIYIIHYLTNVMFFHNNLCFSKNMYLILNRHECNFQLQILHFLKSVLHPFMLFMNAFRKRTCPDWTCTSSKDSLTTIESRPFSRHHLYFALKALPCWKKVTHLQGNNTLCSWKRSWNLRNVLPEKTAVSWTNFFLKILHLQNNPVFCSGLCAVPLWKRNKASRSLKKILHALHKCCPSQKEYWIVGCEIFQPYVSI